MAATNIRNTLLLSEQPSRETPLKEQTNVLQNPNYYRFKSGEFLFSPKGYVERIVGAAKLTKTYETLNVFPPKDPAWLINVKIAVSILSGGVFALLFAAHSWVTRGTFNFIQPGHVPVYKRMSSVMGQDVKEDAKVELTENDESAKNRIPSGDRVFVGKLV